MFQMGAQRLQHGGEIGKGFVGTRGDGKDAGSFRDIRNDGFVIERKHRVVVVVVNALDTEFLEEARGLLVIEPRDAHHVQYRDRNNARYVDGDKIGGGNSSNELWMQSHHRCDRDKSGKFVAPFFL
mmetsp:Transcript_41019/g.44501  ORF Transcript_41019/g.44501 Transcript_41019/m.44501 type:complete len:126 (+) Transcript_41019:122-499(+)